MADWAVIRDDYVTGALTYDKIAEKYGVSLAQVKVHGGSEHWVQLREEFHAKSLPAVMDAAAAARGQMAGRIYDAAGKALDKVAALLPVTDSGKELRALTAALKDIRDILDLRSSEDLEEQRARIAKLRREAEADDGADREISVSMQGLEDYAV